MKLGLEPVLLALLTGRATIQLCSESLNRKDVRHLRLLFRGACVISFLFGLVVARCYGQASAQGQWAALQNWPTRAIHATLLPDGRVFFISYYSESLQPNIWDPTSDTFTATVPAPYALFCSGHASLADGRVLIAGGHIADYTGYPHAQIYDPFKNTFTPTPDMNAGRWYPTVTELANGDLLVTGGDTNPNVTVDPLPQVFQLSSGTWRNLSSAQLMLPLYPTMLLAPNGKVFNGGPSRLTRYLDTTGTGAWTSVATMNFGATRDYGPALMYEVGKVLVVGGADPPTATAETIDLTAATPVWKFTGSMHFPRRQNNAVILPDGKVFIVGGSSGSGFDNSNTPVLPTEMWDPATGQFAVMASIATYRGYHSTALLLPDGRVLSAGGNVGGANAQLFSPPYLFAGAQPTISSAPANVGYGQTVFIGTPDAANISKVTWLKTSSTTHTNDQGQRFMRLSFIQASGGLNVTMPGDPNLSPPGYYMLFLLNSAGVPSVANIIQIIPNGGTTGNVIGSVTNTSGAPLDDVAVAAGSVSATTAVDGSYTLANVNAGAATITASLSGYQSASENMTVSAGIQNKAATLQLAPINPGNVTGGVTDTAGNAIQGANISAAGLSAIADATGTYTLSNLPAGQIMLMVSAAGYEPASETVTVAAGSTTTAPTVVLTSNSGNVTGKVTDSSGTAISGASVGFGGGTTTTDGNGNYMFEAVPAGTIQLVASSAGFQSQTQNVSVNPGATTIANFSLAKANLLPGPVSGNVTNISTGGVIAGATVKWNTVSTTSNSAGAYTINNVTGGSQGLTASASGYLPVTSSVTVSGGATLNFQLSTAGKITVNVVTSAGAPANGATVNITGGVIATNITGTTNTSGLFASNWIPIGNYSVAVTNAGSKTVTAVTGQTSTVTFNQQSVPPGTVAGTVTDSANNPLNGASVVSGSSITTTAADGTYTLTSVPAGAATVTASLTGYQSASQTVNVSSNATITANFALAAAPPPPPTGTVSGTVTNISNGVALAGATVQWNTTTATANGSGVYTLNNVTSGTQTITASATGYLPRSASVNVSGSTTLNFQLATAGKLTVKTITSTGAALSGTSVNIQGGVIATTVTGATNSSGLFTTNWIPVGSYTITVSRTTTQSKGATVSAGQTTTVSFTF